MLKRNMPFLKAQFKVTSINISTALSDGGILTEGLKKKWFDKSVSKTCILVQFTTIDRDDFDSDGGVGAAANQGDVDEDVINIRKF